MIYCFQKLQKSKNENGFSLLELLIYMAILAGFLLVISNIFFTISVNSAKDEARTEVQQNLRFAVGQITSEMRSGKEIISATLPDGGEGNILDIKLVTAGEPVTRFTVSGGVLRKTRNLGLPGEITENLTTDKVTVDIAPLIFSRAGNTIQINLKIDYNDNGRGNYKFFEKMQTAVSLRI